MSIMWDELSFFKISLVLERILMEHIQTKSSLCSKLQIVFIRSIEIRSGNRDIFKILFGNGQKSIPDFNSVVSR